jgi:hypothetical protein
MLLHDDFNEAVAAARRKRIKSRNSRAVRQDAEEVACSEAAKAMSDQPPP